jgi:hypothetical protein
VLLIAVRRGSSYPVPPGCGIAGTCSLWWEVGSRGVVELEIHSFRMFWDLECFQGLLLLAVLLLLLLLLS